MGYAVEVKMPKLWLPITSNGRTRNILIPNVQDIDRSQLDEIIQWQTEKTIKELNGMPEKKPVSVMKREEAAGALREYGEWLAKRKQ